MKLFYLQSSDIIFRIAWFFWDNFFAFLWFIIFRAYLLSLHQIIYIAAHKQFPPGKDQQQIHHPKTNHNNQYPIMRWFLINVLQLYSLDTFPSIWKPLWISDSVTLWVGLFMDFKVSLGPEQVWVLQEHIYPPFRFSGAEDMIKSNKKLNSQDGATNAITSNNVNKQVNSLALFCQPNAQNR